MAKGNDAGIAEDEVDGEREERGDGDLARQRQVGGEEEEG